MYGEHQEKNRELEIFQLKLIPNQEISYLYVVEGTAVLPRVVVLNLEPTFLSGLMRRIKSELGRQNFYNEQQHQLTNTQSSQKARTNSSRQAQALRIPCDLAMSLAIGNLSIPERLWSECSTFDSGTSYDISWR